MPDFNLRSFLCLCLVVALHIVIIYIFIFKNTFSEKIRFPPRSLHYVAIIQSKPLPFSSPRPAPGITKRTDPPLGPASNFVSAPSSLIEPAPESLSSPPNELPKLDLNTSRASAVQHELNRERSPIELQNERNRRDQRLEARLEKRAKEAEHTDCRTAYAQTGLLAPLFITADLLNDKGCKF